MLAKLLTAAVGMAVVPAMFLAVGPQGQSGQADADAPTAVAESPRRSSTIWSRSPGAIFPTTAYGLARRDSTDSKIQAAAKELRQAESSSERSEAKDKLMGLLSEDYDSRLKEYEEYLDGLEKQLEEMRGKLRKRRQAKDDMIDLRIKVLEAEADDLGWPTRMRGSRAFGVTVPGAELPRLTTGFGKSAKPAAPVRVTGQRAGR